MKSRVSSYNYEHLERKDVPSEPGSDLYTEIRYRKRCPYNNEAMIFQQLENKQLEPEAVTSEVSKGGYPRKLPCP